MDAAVLIGGCHAALFGTRSLVRPMSGFPLAFAFFACALWMGALCLSGAGGDRARVALSICELTVAVDALQYVQHRCAHLFWKGSHAKHHVHIEPSVEHAFETGARDGVFQLLGPILLAAYLLRPSRCALIAYGCAFSLWLKYIHSGSEVALERFGIVDARYHSRHHRYSSCNFGHVLTVWDTLGGTRK